MTHGLAAQQGQLKRAILGAEPAGLLRTAAGREPLLHIYRQAYVGRLASALRDNFGVLPQVLGDDAFDALARAYIEAQPSRRPSIRWFGDGLAAFMAERDDLVPHPALIDLARMEWALRTAFDAADAPAIDVQALAGVAAEVWPSLVFDAVPSVQLLELAWNVAPVWRALQDRAGDDAPDLVEPPPEPQPQPPPQPLAHCLLVWRHGLSPRWRSVEALTARLLHAALRGERFDALCALAAQTVGDEQAALDAASALHGWLADGLFRGWRSA